jgi:hypothetical protein
LEVTILACCLLRWNGQDFPPLPGKKKYFDPVELWGTLFSDKPTWVWTMVLSIFSIG